MSLSVIARRYGAGHGGRDRHADFPSLETLFGRTANISLLEGYIGLE
jgi:hypothetical protein